MRVFENLIENALKYAASGKKIDIALAIGDGTKSAREASVKVRDYGPGIAPEHLPRLTERFYRVDVTESRAQGGTGLGLALVKHILNRHGGRLTIESIAGQGATFTAHLPVAGTRGKCEFSSIRKRLGCHPTVIERSYNDDMRRVDIPAASERTRERASPRRSPEARGYRVIRDHQPEPETAAAGSSPRPLSFWPQQQERALKLFHTLTAAGLLAMAAAAPAAALDISGAGATFPYPIYAKWADAYKKETGIGMNYQSIGSGGGIKQIEAKTVTFGATDAPLKGEDLDKNGLVQFPMVMGGIVPVVNLDGIKPGDLVHRRPDARQDLPRRDQDRGTTPRSRSSIPSAKLPAQAIAVVHRSDGSGTTFNFTDYLSKVSPDWKSKVGSNTAVEWPVGIGAKGNEGVSTNVAQTKGVDRLRRICLRQAEQADLHQDAQQGRQDRRPDHRRRSRPRPPTPTGIPCPAMA